MTRIAVNMLWCRHGKVGGSEQYLVRQLLGLREATNREFDVDVYAPRGFTSAHPQLAQVASIHESKSAQNTRPLRVLSCPCATGEEPYSVVMALLDAGFPPESFVVDGFDISRRVLADAAAGHYRGRAFRGMAPHVRARSFTHDLPGSTWHIHPSIREAVTLTTKVYLGTTLITSNPAKIAKGKTVTFRLTTTTALKGKSIQVWRKIGTGLWAKYTTKTIDSYGKASFTYYVSRADVTWRFQYAGDTRYAPTIGTARRILMK